MDIFTESATAPIVTTVDEMESPFVETVPAETAGSYDTSLASEVGLYDGLPIDNGAGNETLDLEEEVGLPEDDEEGYADDPFERESENSFPVPRNIGVPFAPDPPSGSHYPIQSSHRRGGEINYEAETGGHVGRNKSRRFGADRGDRNRRHAAIDIYANAGDQVIACQDGQIVSFYGFCCGKSKTSWALIVDHGAVVINYGEVARNSLSRLGLSKGSQVRSGQTIGYVGVNPNGSSMLHFETYAAGTRSNKQWRVGSATPAALRDPTRYLLHLMPEPPSPRSSSGRPSAPAGQRTLRRGSRGDDVRALQAALTAAGFPASVDGSFGMATANAVRAFQSVNGLAVDGVVGSRTWGAIGASGVSGAAAGAVAGTPRATVSIDAPNTALGTLVVKAPGREHFRYEFTREDLIWTAKLLVHEAGGEEDVENAAVLWAMFNRYALFTHRHYSTFTAFVRRYSTTLQPVLRSRRAAERHCRKGDAIYQKTGGFYEGSKVPKGQLVRHLRIQAAPWGEVKASARRLATQALRGELPNPGIGVASEFASTWVFYRQRYDRKPSRQEWIDYTRALARRKKWEWVELAGVPANKNAFFLQSRAKDLPSDAVRVVAPSRGGELETGEELDYLDEFEFDDGFEFEDEDLGLADELAVFSESASHDEGPIEFFADEEEYTSRPFEQADQATGPNEELAEPQHESTQAELATSELASARFKTDRDLVAVAEGTMFLARRGKTRSHPTLSSGAGVRLVQQALLDLAYALPKFGADGDYGAETKSAVQQFQKENGLSPDGVVGSATLERLDAEIGASDRDLASQTSTTQPPLGDTARYWMDRIRLGLLGNTVEPLIDGPAAFAAIKRAIETAQDDTHYIYLTAWWCDPWVNLAGPGTSLLDLFAKAGAAGVQIRGLLWGPRWPVFRNQISLNTAAAAALSRLPNCDVQVDEPPETTKSHHQKLIVVRGTEGLVALQGGVDINADRIHALPPPSTAYRSDRPTDLGWVGGGSGSGGTEGAGSPLHDLHCLVSGPTALPLMRAFLRRWWSRSGSRSIDSTAPLRGRYWDPVPAPTGTQIVRIGETFDAEMRFDGRRVRDRGVDAQDIWLRSILGARKFIYMEDQYLTHPCAAEAINSRLPELDHVIILIPPSEITDFPLRWRLRREFINIAARGPHGHKVRVYTRAVDPTGSCVLTAGRHLYIHSKAAVIDDEVLLIGSANCNHRGWETDSELVVASFDQEDSTTSTAKQLRMRLWMEHLGVPASAVRDAELAKDLWDGATTRQVCRYDPSAGSDSWPFDNVKSWFGDPEDMRPGDPCRTLLSI